MPYANDQGVELWYEMDGEGESLVMTGGFGLLHDQFAKIRHLLTPPLQVIDWHYRGVGLSDRAWPGGYPLDRWVDDLALILDHTGLDRVHLWGTSTGAPLTVRFAARYPHRVKSVITYPGISFTPESRRRETHIPCSLPNLDPVCVCSTPPLTQPTTPQSDARQPRTPPNHPDTVHTTELRLHTIAFSHIENR